MSIYKTSLDVPVHGDPPVQSRSVLPWVWFFLKPYKKIFALLTLNRGGRMIYFAGIQPLLLAKIIQAFENGSAYTDPTNVWTLVGIFVLSASFVYFLLLFCAQEARLYDRVGREARLYGLSLLNRLSAQWHERFDSGGKLQKILTGSNGLKQLIRIYFIYILNFFAGFIGTAIALFGMGMPPVYLALFAGLMISYIAFAWWSSVYVGRGYDEQNRLFETLVGKVYEFVNATLTVKIFNLGAHILSHARKGEQEGHEQVCRVYWLDYARWVGLNFIGLFWVVLILGLGIHQTLDNILSLAAFTLAAYQAMHIWGLLEEFTSVYSQIGEQRSGFKRLTELLSEPVQVDDDKQGDILKVENGAIEFKNISFGYNKDNRLFDGLELTIEAGEKVGIVGPSGSGKSTLVKLLLRFYDPLHNEITIDRQNIQKVTQESLRQNIAVIPQDVSLFNHSVMDNIRYGRLDASDEEVIRAAEFAHADEFIRKLAQGYETIVGEQGMRLSGGQKQRIAIARAILKDAPILVLDEATSALDSESERLIQLSLSRLMREKTVIAIAHRLSTIAAMDRILVFDKGRLVEQGTHEELLAMKGQYSKLWSLQVNGFIDETALNN